MARRSAAVASALTTASLALVGCNELVERLVERQVERQVAANVTSQRELETELMRPGHFEIVLCGTSAPLPNPRAQSCTAVFANGQFLVFDIGSGAQESLERLQLPIQHIDSVFLTHFHNDHFADLGELIDRTWIFGRRTSLQVYGPPGVEAVVQGFLQAYRLEFGYRTAHHGEDIMPPGKHAARGVPIELDAGTPSRSVYERDGVVVRAFLVDHAPVVPSFGFVVEFAGRRVVLSGDTDDTPLLWSQAKGADVLVSEVMNKPVVDVLSRALGARDRPDQSRILEDIQDYHIDGAALGARAREADVDVLVLTHLVPAVDNTLLLRWLFGEPVGDAFQGELVIGEDGTRVVVVE